MKKMLKSWNERIYGPQEKCSIPKGYSEPYEVRSVTQVVDNGRVVKASQINMYVPSENTYFKDVKVNDMKLENIIAAGADVNLKSVQISPSGLDAIDRFDSVANDVLDLVEYLETNNNSNNTEE